MTSCLMIFPDLRLRKEEHITLSLATVRICCLGGGGLIFFIGKFPEKLRTRIQELCFGVCTAC